MVDREPRLSLSIPIDRQVVLLLPPKSGAVQCASDVTITKPDLAVLPRGAQSVMNNADPRPEALRSSAEPPRVGVEAPRPLDVDDLPRMDVRGLRGGVTPAHGSAEGPRGGQEPQHVAADGGQNKAHARIMASASDSERERAPAAVTFQREEPLPTLVDFNDTEFPRKPKFDIAVKAERAVDKKLRRMKHVQVNSIPCERPNSAKRTLPEKDSTRPSKVESEILKRPLQTDKEQQQPQQQQPQQQQKQPHNSRQRQQQQQQQQSVATVKVIVGLDGKSATPSATILGTSEAVCENCIERHSVANRCVIEEALADGIDEMEFELRAQLANLKTNDGQTLMEACPEIKEILNEYSRTLEQAKIEAGLRGYGKARASRVAALTEPLPRSPREMPGLIGPIHNPMSLKSPKKRPNSLLSTVFIICLVLVVILCIVGILVSVDSNKEPPPHLAHLLTSTKEEPLYE